MITNLEHICIKPILKCNQRCPTCQKRQLLHQHLNNIGFQPLTVDEWDSVFKDLKSLCKQPIISISGGEPLIDRRLVDIVKTAKKYTDNITINTNGTLLSPEHSMKLLSAGITRFNITMDEFNAEDYKSARGILNEKMYYKTLYNIKQFNTIRKLSFPNVKSVNVIIMTENRWLKLDNIIKLSKVLSFDEVSLDPLEADFEHKHIVNIDKFLQTTYRKLPSYYKHQIHRLINLYSSDHYKLYGQYRKTQTEPNCNIPGNFCIILANGDIHQCNVIEYSHEPIIGNIRQIKLSELEKQGEFQIYDKVRSKYCLYCPINLEVGVKLE